MPCPAGGRTSRNKKIILHWLWHLKMFILVLWMILSKYQLFRSPAMFRFCVPHSEYTDNFFPHFTLKNRNRGSILDTFYCLMVLYLHQRWYLYYGTEKYCKVQENRMMWSVFWSFIQFFFLSCIMLLCIMLLCLVGKIRSDLFSILKLKIKKMEMFKIHLWNDEWVIQGVDWISIKCDLKFWLLIAFQFIIFFPLVGINNATDVWLLWND